MTKPSSVLIVHQSSELYGSDRMLLRLLKALPDRVITLHVPAHGPLIDHVQPVVQHLVIAPMSILRLNALKKFHWLNPFSFFRNVWYARHHVRNTSCVVLNSSVILTYMLLLPFYRLKKLVYIHELPTGLIRWGLNILLYTTGATLICNSRATTAAYPLIPTARKLVIYNNVATPVLVAKPTSPTTPLHILMIGRISQRKGQHILLHALNLLSAAECAQLEIRLVGGSYHHRDSYHRHITQACETVQKWVNLQLIPFTSDPSSHYDWAHIVIVPSIQPESFGLVALEAMHHTCAVIASNIGALPEIVKDHISGLLIKPDDPHSLAAAIRYYLKHPTQIISHGTAGQAIARTQFDPNAYDQHIQQVINAV